jgi:hypothetical protein
LVDSQEKRKLPRVNARWPVTIVTEKGEVDGETRNITVEGVFLHCLERLREGEVYRMTIKLPEQPVEVAGKLAWSNLDNFHPDHAIPGMGFCFVKISEKDRGRLGDAIASHRNKAKD